MPDPFSERTLPLTAFKNDILISYLLFKLFEGEDRYSSTSIIAAKCGDLPTEWIPKFVQKPQKPRHKSWDALAAIVFGQAHKRDDMIGDGLGLYGQALTELRENLENPEELKLDSTLASMTALYMYEVCCRVNNEQWSSIDRCRYWCLRPKRLGYCTYMGLSGF
jgi:hypothetical protein